MSSPKEVCRFEDHMSLSDKTNTHSHSHDQHGHSHEQLDNPGKYAEREKPLFERRNWKERAFTVGIGG